MTLEDICNGLANMNTPPNSNIVGEQTKTTKVYIRLAELIDWKARCDRTNNQHWAPKVQDFIDEVMGTAPSGSGIDCGTELLEDECSPTKLVFNMSFHHMNEPGYYDGWSEHQVIIKPTFGGFDMRITGRDRNDIKDYLGEVYDCWLHELTSV